MKRCNFTFLMSQPPLLRLLHPPEYLSSVSCEFDAFRQRHLMITWWKAFQSRRKGSRSKCNESCGCILFWSVDAVEKHCVSVSVIGNVKRLLFSGECIMFDCHAGTQKPDILCLLTSDASFILSTFIAAGLVMSSDIMFSMFGSEEENRPQNKNRRQERYRTRSCFVTILGGIVSPLQDKADDIMYFIPTKTNWSIACPASQSLLLPLTLVVYF